MAAPLVQRVTLDSTAALRELAQLERQLLQLNQPINVPVDVDVDGTRQAENQMGQLRREVDQTGDEFVQLGRKADDSVDGILRVGTRGASAFTSLRGSIIGVGAAIAAIQGVRILGNFAAGAIQSASNLEESLSKTNVVFEDFSGDIQNFARDAPRALGLSTAAALEATSTFGNLFIALGLSRDAAAELSPDIVQLAADLASFNNIAVSEAVEKLRSGLVGEVEPLRTLGVNLNAATVEAKALELGFVGANGAVTEAGKVQARYALILEQTTTAQGDYARTADGIANTQRTLSAEFENAKTVIGQALIPAYQALLRIVPGVISALEGLAPSVTAVAVAFADGVGEAERFLNGLAEGARIIPTTVSGLLTLGEAAVNTVQALGGFLSLDFENAATQVEQLTQGIGGLVEQLQLSSLTGGFIDQLKAGVDPAKALANALVELTALDLNPEDFAQAAEAFGRISGLDTSRIKDVTDLIRDQGEELGIEASAISAVIAGLRELNSIPPPPARPGSRGSDRGQTDREITQSALERAAALTQAAREEAAAAALVGSSFEDTTNTLSDFDVTSIVSQLQNLAGGFKDVAPEIGNLPDLLSDARTALQSEQGGIVEDFDEFFANLETALAARQDFNANLLILRAMGLDDLADTFATLGLDSAQALADAITDPAKAAEAESILEGQAQDQAHAFRDAFEAELASMIADLPVEVQLQQIQIPEIQAALNIQPFGGGQGVGDVIINNTFNSTPNPTTDTVRINQSLNQIRTGPN